MKAVINFFIVFWGISSIILSKRVYGRWVNAISVFCGVWTIDSVCSLFGAFQFYIPDIKVYFAILIVEIVFSLTTFCFHSVFLKFSIYTSLQKESFISKKVNTHFWCYVLIIVCIPLVLKALPFWKDANVKGLRHSFLLAKNGHMGYWGYYIYSYFIRPLMGVVSLSAIVKVFREQTNRVKNFVFALMLSTLHVIISAGRKELFNVLIFAIFACLVNGNHRYIYNNGILKFKKKKASSIIVYGLLVIVIVLVFCVTAKRLYFGLGIWGTIWQYGVGPIGYLNVILSRPESFALNNSNLLYGKALFGWITIPFDTVASVVSGSRYNGADISLARYSNVFFNISPYVKLNAAETIIYAFLRDFGKCGLVIGPILLSIFVSIIEVCRELIKTEIWECILISVYFMLLFSVWRYSYAYVDGAMTFFYLLLFAIVELLSNKMMLKTKEFQYYRIKL